MNRPPIPKGIKKPTISDEPQAHYRCRDCDNFVHENLLHWCIYMPRPNGNGHGNWRCDAHCSRRNGSLICGPNPMGLCEYLHEAPYNERWFWTWPMARFQSHMRNVSNNKEKTT